MALNYLLDPMFQIENTAGKPATDGWLEVYIHGTRTKYYCASNFDGTLHPFKIKLDSLGSNIVLADDGQAYDVYAYNRFGSLLMSRYNVQPGNGGSGSGGIVSELEHWLGGYGPTYTPFPGDNIGHTLGISTGRLQGSGGVDYVGDFIDHIATCPYPDGVYDGYIYLKPGVYYVDCIIRYQQASDSLSNTLDEVLIYTGYGNANESLAYQFDYTGPEATGNRHNVRVSFVRHVTENEGSILYFAPATPVNWKEAYIQKLQIVRLDGVKGERGDEGKSAYEVWLDQGNTGSEQDFLDSLQGPQGPQGVQGPAGPAGPQGPTGPKGADGDVSFDELTPEQIEELRGPAGPQGPQGIQGVQGPTGPTGPKGDKGDTGEQGEQGPQGPAGADGESAYEVWLDQGNTGTEQDFLDSLQGEQGPQGIQGPIGPAGPTGADGHDGTTPPVVPLVAGTNINIEESNGSIVISADGGDESLWQVAEDGNIEPKDGKHFEASGAISYEAYWDYYFAKLNRVKSDDVGLRVDHMVASHRGDASTPFGPFNVSATLRTDHSSNPYQGSRKAGLVLDDNQTGTGTNPRARIDMYAGSNGEYSLATYKDQTYVQAIVANDYVRMRSDDIIRHVGSTDGHALFVLAHKSDTTKTYVMQPTATAGVYELVEETSGGSSYTAGEGIDITNNVISVDPDSLPAGPTGPQGPAGPTGATGSDGESAYNIWLDQGNVGTEQDFLDSLEGPQGPVGPQGPQGIQGEQGEQGPAGAVPPGLNLVAGTNINITASSNSIVISATGGGSTYTAGEGIDITNNVISVDPNSLPEGPQGPQGPQGPAGATGADGESAYDIWLDQGNTGTKQDFLDSLQGEQGPQGIQGIQGPKGDKGDTGEQGPAGTVPPGLNLTAGDNISITANGSTVTIGATGVATTAQLAGKQNTLTGITDIQVVQSLPASPVATVLYLIPEA